MPQLGPHESKFREIRQLELELAKKKASIGMDHPAEVTIHEEEEEEKEEVKEFVTTPMEIPQAGKAEQKAEKENVFENMVATVKSAASGSLAKADEEKNEEMIKDAKSIAVLDEERKIQTLSALAWQKGITYSIEVARKLEDPNTLDRLHAHLSNELYDKLVSAKKLDEI